MRVTKTIKEYIYKEVRARIEPKYEAERKEVERRETILNNIRDGALEAANKVYQSYILTQLGKDDNESFIEYTPSDTDLTTGYRNHIVLKDRFYVNTIYGWRNRCDNEVREKSEEIIVELELGGDKNRLMELLNNI